MLMVSLQYIQTNIEQAGTEVKLWTWIREVLSSNLCWVTGYPKVFRDTPRSL
jgi:hypothetical protein